MSALSSSSSSSSSTTAAAQQLLATLPPSQSCLPAFTLDYYHVAARAYNMTRYLVNALQLDDTVFATAMCYWHEFATRLGHRRVHAVVLAAACVFLAGKVEHYKLRVDQIVALVFEVRAGKREGAPHEQTQQQQQQRQQGGGNSSSSTVLDEDDDEAMAAGWRRMVLEVELVLSDALQFDFQRTHPCQAMLALLASPAEVGAGDGGAATDTTTATTAVAAGQCQDVVAEMQAIATRFYVLSLITPLYATLSPASVLYTIAYMTAAYSPHARLYAQLWRTSTSTVSSASSSLQLLPPPSSVERACVMSVMLDAFALMGKRTGLAVLDELVSVRRRSVARSSNNSSSSNSSST